MFDVEKIREEFPILHREVYGKPLVYLDSGATAQKPRTVIETVDRLHRELNANIHRGVHFLSEEATMLYEAARERIAAFVGAAAKEEIIFTAGATASLNTVAYAWGDAFVGAGDNILVSEMEHHSNIVPWQMLAERKGAEIRVLPFDEAGALRTDLLPSLVDERTRVVAVTQASNTLGTRPDLRTVVEAAHAAGAVVVVDGCQGVVHGGVDVRAMDCDFYAFSGHKLYGPTGIGVLYGKRELLERIRDIRSSEKVMYRQVLDLYATSVDYNPRSAESVAFFKMVQNKLHYAAHGHTAAEVIDERANADKPFMELTTFSGDFPTAKDIGIAKNYLTEEELRVLNQMVSGYFDFAEVQAIRHRPMYMSDYVEQLDNILRATGEEVLTHAGKISHAQAMEKAKAEYKRYQAQTLSPVEEEYLKTIKQLGKTAKTEAEKQDDTSNPS